MKKLFTLCLMGVLGMGLTTACLVVDTDECSSLTFDEYCFGNQKVECIGGDRKYTSCDYGYTCMEYVDRAECVPDGIPCNAAIFDEYCSNGGVVECIDGIEQISYCNSGYVCAVFDDYNDQAECVPDVIPCDPNYFDEYCDGNTPVWCINGIETYGNTCSFDQTCVEFIDGLDRASCVIPDFVGYGGNLCDPYTDSSIELRLCNDGITYISHCHETNTPDYYWEVVDYVECPYGCNYAGTDCAR